MAKNEDRRTSIAFVGSVKWHEAKPFGLREYAELAVIDGQQPRPSRTPDLEWLIAAIDSQLGITDSLRQRGRQY